MDGLKLAASVDYAFLYFSSVTSSKLIIISIFYFLSNFFEVNHYINFFFFVYFKDST